MENSDNRNSFDRLVSGLTSGERESLLEKMNSSGKEEESLVSEDRIIRDERISFSEQIKTESIFYRLWLWIKALFTNTSVEALYNEHLLYLTSRQTEHDFPGLIDYKRELLISGFYDKLNELKLCADFFRPYIAAEDKDEDSFLIFLGSVVMQDVYAQFNEKVDPYSLPVTKEPKSEQRMAFLKNLELITASIPEQDRNAMYDAVRAVEWLKQFTRLPFQRFISLFSSVTGNEHTCAFASIDSELSAFSKVLSNGPKISENVLKALFLFSRKNRASLSLEAAEADSDLAAEFITNARAQISMMKMFITTVPLYPIGCIVYGDSRWHPDNFTGGEDWFVRFKAAWKKLFDRKWESWTNDCKKEILRKRLENNFELEKFPLLPHRPWSVLWGGMPFRYELTAGFLYWYFNKVFPSHETILKTIMLEGDFIQKDNRQEFTDSYNSFVQISIDLSNFDRRMAPGGEYGSIFSRLQNERLRSLQTQSKIDTIMRASEADIRGMLNSFGEACRIFELCFSGIFKEKSDSRYDSLSNLKKIGGKDPDGFHKSLVDARVSIRNVYELIKDLEPVDTPGLLTK